ncbi:hypothetical protein [Sphingomonas sanxanigenens]|uniref:Uncharacterized protein n=1 Tax=Sphingomonas sanxanigenens DSM 19645 = NX02 TaxID=1123269 RepID=W0AE75_9SPHN|nr:hypothetical protein [Sphingomonas sanxanigenens]AHE54857.1 hypothetical protein NX02_15885 [Sphingomonas sanxanigenens DSM 19645 = NX02]
MGMIPIDQPPARPAALPQQARSERQPEPELRDRFEDAMAKRRKAGTGEPERFSGATPASAPGHAHPPVTGQQAFEGYGDQPRKGKAMAADAKSSDAPTATPQQNAPLAAAEPAPVSAPQSANLSASFAEIVARIDMPASATGGETLLTMSDTRWLATQAVIARDDAGGLMLDIDARGDDAEQQREALKARLEARGHRVGKIRING